MVWDDWYVLVTLSLGLLFRLPEALDAAKMKRYARLRGGALRNSEDTSYGFGWLTGLAPVEIRFSYRNLDGRTHLVEGRSTLFGGISITSDCRMPEPRIFRRSPFGGPRVKDQVSRFPVGLQVNEALRPKPRLARL